MALAGLPGIAKLVDDILVMVATKEAGKAASQWHLHLHHVHADGSAPDAGRGMHILLLGKRLLRNRFRPVTSMPQPVTSNGEVY